MTEWRTIYSRAVSARIGKPFDESLGEDARAATRRAIVKAAAEVGRNINVRS